MLRPYSVSLHPWDVTTNYQDTLLQLKQHLSQQNCFAIGEVGLDKVKGPPLALQRECFQEVLALAKGQDKPLILHSVRTHEICLTMLKQNQVFNPVLIHGFYGDIPRESQTSGLNIYYGFGASLFSNSRRTINSFLSLKLERILLESDDQTRYDLGSIYMRAAQLRGVDVIAMKQQMQSNSERFLGTTL